MIILYKILEFKSILLLSYKYPTRKTTLHTNVVLYKIKTIL